MPPTVMFLSPVQTVRRHERLSAWRFSAAAHFAGGSNDDFEWLEKHPVGTEPETPPIPLLDLSNWSADAIAPKTFLLENYIPARELTLITGAGGVNKSTFGQQLSTCVAAGLPMMGVPTKQGKALYVTAEDDEQWLSWMQEHICSALGVSVGAMQDTLWLSSLRGRLNNELALFDYCGSIQATPTFESLKATVSKILPSLVVLDNAAHFFAGNENDRGQVTAFANLLYSLSLDFGCTVALVAHSNKQGDAYSGSTAWLNAVRSHIVITRNEKGMDEDARELTLGKANYARQGEKLSFRWHNFALRLDDDFSEANRMEWAATAKAAEDEAIFLACIRERNRQKRAVSEKRSPSYAPSEFLKMAESKKIGKTRLEAAMDRLFRSGTIERAVLWKGPDRKPVSGLRETAGNGAGDTVQRTLETD